MKKYHALGTFGRLLFVACVIGLILFVCAVTGENRDHTQAIVGAVLIMITPIAVTTVSYANDKIKEN